MEKTISINPNITLTGTKAVTCYENELRRRAEAKRAESVRAESVRADRRAEKLAENFGRRALS